jgi:hypothetical protein
MAWPLWIAQIFSSGKSVETVVETGSKISLGLMDGLDHMRFGEQERAEFSQEGAKIVLSFWEQVAKESTEQSKARRALAMLTLKSFFYMIFLAILCRIAGTMIKPLIEVSKFILGIALSGIVGGLVISIGAIYFGPHQLSKIVDFRKKK